MRTFFVFTLFAPLLSASESLLVLSKGATSLSIVDPAGLKVMGTVPVGQDPHEVIASADGTTAYVSNYGGGTLHTIAVIDLVNRKALDPIDMGGLRGAHGLVFVGGKLWFTAEGSKAVGSYDPAAHKIDWVMGTGQNRTHMIYVWPDLSHMVTTNISSATMTFIEKRMLQPPGPPRSGQGPPRMAPPPRADWDETVVPVGRGAEGFDVSPDNKEIWAANAGDGTISIIDNAARKVVQTLDADVRSANRLKFTPDGKRVLVSMLNNPDLAIFDVAGRRSLKRLPIGHGAAGILVQPDGARAFVSCTPDNYVAIVDLKSLQVTGHLDAGPQPDGLAWARRD